MSFYSKADRKAGEATMAEYPLVLGVAAFDLLLLTSLYLCLRLQPQVPRVALLPTAFGLSGFVFHAFLFLGGPFLILQLATIGAVFGLVAFFSVRKQPRT
jgi:hypothetical protein